MTHFLLLALGTLATVSLGHHAGRTSGHASGRDVVALALHLATVAMAMAGLIWGGAA